MADKQVTIQEVRNWVRQFRKERGWGGGNENAKNLAISLVLEAVELLEHYQWLEGDEVERDKKRKQEAAFELVDVLYWVVTLADTYKIDLSGTLKEKLMRNVERYPAEKFPVKLERGKMLRRYYKLKKGNHGH